MRGAGGPFLMAAHVRTVQVPEADRRELERRARDSGAAAREVERAGIVLLAADGVPGQQIAEMVGCAEGTVVTWRGRYAERGLTGLADRPRSGKPSPLPEALRDRVLTLTLTEPPTALGATHWSSRLLADALAAEGTPISHATIARIWHRFGVRPWRAETFKFSTDPQLEGKIRDVVGLYLHPPEQAVVLCVDEKPQIQALERTGPTLPVRPGHPERQTFDYVRHGTTTLFAALEVATGKVTDACTEPHRHQVREGPECLGRQCDSASARLGGRSRGGGRLSVVHARCRGWRCSGTSSRGRRAPAACHRAAAGSLWSATGLGRRGRRCPRAVGGRACRWCRAARPPSRWCRWPAHRPAAAGGAGVAAGARHGCAGESAGVGAGAAGCGRGSGRPAAGARRSRSGADRSRSASAGCRCRAILGR